MIAPAYELGMARSSLPGLLEFRRRRWLALIYTAPMDVRTTLLGTAVRVLLVSASLVYCACFSPTYREGLACSESGECPGSQTCIEGSCQLGGGGALADARGPDADLGPTVDAEPGTPDATTCPADSQIFEFTGAMETFTLPACATSMHIEAFGAQGGGGRTMTGGGLGAKVAGDFVVNGGEVLQILVGGRGLDATPPGSIVGQSFTVLQQGGGTGGGGSFVIDPDGVPLAVAGGGGGVTHTGVLMNNVVAEETLLPGGPGQSGEAGQDGGGSEAGIGGTGGLGGGFTSNPLGFHSGTGGGGFSGNGDGSSDGIAMYGTSNAPGSSFLAGGAGGVGGSLGRNGGFGGGGSAGFSGGGGGGYSGGGSGGYSGALHGGGGGGSFNSGTNTDNQPGLRAGNGQITISYE